MTRARATVARVPQWTQIAVAGGLVGILLIGVATAGGWIGGHPAAKKVPQAQPSTAPTRPLIDAQEFVYDGGIRVNVPKAWTQAKAKSSFVDFTDPQDRGRRLRVNVESSGLDPHAFLATAGENLKKKDSGCAAPYTQVGLRDVQLDGKKAAELEYTCGTGDTQRHGIWRAVVTSGKAYHFFLTVPAARFDESKLIYDEMVRSFHLTA